MATQAQIDPNRINAQKSTGPRTPEGKANSRRNALKLGLSASALMISGEDPREMAEFGEDYLRMFTPANAFQRFHLENIIYCEWMIRRCRRIEAELMNHLMAKDRSVPFEVEAGCAFERDAAGANALHKLHRRMNSLEKSYYRSLRELQASGVRFDGSAPEPGSTSASDPNDGFEYNPGPENYSQAAPEPEPEPVSESPATPEGDTAEPEKLMPPSSLASPPDSMSEIGFVLSNSESVASSARRSAKSRRAARAGTPGK
jgi:hypothetical protein